MYLHIGKGKSVDQREIVGIFDLDICSQSHLTRKYLTMAEKAGQVSSAAEDIPRSFVVCERAGERRVLLSQMSPATLQRRSENP